MTKHIGIYPGTFDPITNGHLDIIERGQKLFDEMIVAVAESPRKGTLFSIEERVSMIKTATKKYKNVSVESFKGLLIDYVHKKNAGVILRGLRVISDFEYEFQMALTNRKLAHDIETVFMMTKEEYAYVSSRFIKEIARLGGNLKGFVPQNVSKKLKEKYKTQKSV
ncbi:MAG: pantetheine-phosphate adenylyltransferase [Deltaproteobacteria bacterium]|nr:pantetheine-phosphate adenylyltransferase [Deltaproteobacteria bacterium]